MSTRVVHEPAPSATEPTRVIKSVGFSLEQWDHIERYTAEHKIKHGTFLRNAALAQVGAPTDAKNLLELASIVDKSVRQAEVSAPKPAKPAPAPAKTAKKR